MSLSADPRLAVDFAITEAFKRMAPDNYRPMPDKPEAATHTPTSRGLEGPVKDPFDQYARTPVALYRDGRQYEADELTAGATP